MQPSSARDHSDHARRVSGTRYMETRNNPCPACLVRLQRSPLTCYGRDVEEQHASSTAVHVLTSAHKVCSQSSVRESSNMETVFCFCRDHCQMGWGLSCDQPWKSSTRSQGCWSTCSVLPKPVPKWLHGTESTSKTHQRV